MLGVECVGRDSKQRRSKKKMEEKKWETEKPKDERGACAGQVWCWGCGASWGEEEDGKNEETPKKWGQPPKKMGSKKLSIKEKKNI